MDWRKAWPAFFIAGAIGYLIGWFFDSVWVCFVLFFAMGYLGYHYQEAWQKLKQALGESFGDLKRIVWDKNPAKFLSYLFFSIAMYCLLTIIWSGFTPEPNGPPIGLYQAVKNLEVGKLLYAPWGVCVEIREGLLGEPLWMQGLMSSFLLLALFLSLLPAVCAAFVGIGLQLFLINLFNGKILKWSLIAIEVVATRIVLGIFLSIKWLLRLEVLKRMLKGIGIVLYFSGIFIPFLIFKGLLNFIIAIHSWQRVACGLYVLTGGAIYILFVPLRFTLPLTSALSIGCGLWCMALGYLFCKVLSSKAMKKLAEARIWPLQPKLVNA